MIGQGDQRDFLFVGADHDLGGPDIFAQVVGKDDLDSSIACSALATCTPSACSSASSALRTSRAALSSSDEWFVTSRAKAPGRRLPRFCGPVGGRCLPAAKRIRKWKKNSREYEGSQPSKPQTAGSSRSHVWNGLIIARDEGWLFISLVVGHWPASLFSSRDGRMRPSLRNPDPRLLRMSSIAFHVFRLAYVAGCAHAAQHVVGEEKLAVGWDHHDLEFVERRSRRFC